MTGEEKLRREGLPEEAVAAFRQLYDQLAAGASGALDDAELEPVRGLAQLPRPAATASLLEALAGFGDVVDFLQHKVPKLRADDLTAVEWPVNPALEWCPPGHGDLYAALRASGTLCRRSRGWPGGSVGVRHRQAWPSPAARLPALHRPRRGQLRRGHCGARTCRGV